MNLLKTALTIIALAFALVAFTQTNCNVYGTESECYKACKEYEKALEGFSGDRYFQQSLLKAIELCPTFHYAHFELSVNYAKRGLMHQWKPLIDRAVALSPQTHLGWRAWYHWFFAHNYQKAIEDIEKLETLVSYDIGTTGDGMYHLTILKGLCYAGLGQTQKAIETVTTCMNSNEEYFQGSFDYLHLAVPYLKIAEVDKAMEALVKQQEFYDMSEVHFYRGKGFLILGQKEKALNSFEIALEKYEEGIHMHDPYRQIPDEIYLLDIAEELAAIK